MNKVILNNDELHPATTVCSHAEETPLLLVAKLDSDATEI